MARKKAGRIREGQQRDMIKELSGNLAARRQWRNVQSFSGNIADGPKDVGAEMGKQERCECHACTQARYRLSFQWQLDQMLERGQRHEQCQSAGSESDPGNGAEPSVELGNHAAEPAGER